MGKKNNSRRKFLSTLLSGGLVAASGVASAAAPGQTGQIFTYVREPKILGMRNLHTGEIFNAPYKIGDQYIEDSFEHLSYLLRDHRTGDTHDIDRHLVEYLHALKQRANRDNDFVVLSGYRSPKTNEMLRRKTSGVARNSYHMQGKAIDIRIPGYSSIALQNDARSLRAGGVGFYQDSKFVHLDTGPIRSW